MKMKLDMNPDDFAVSISLKIDQTGNIVETSLGWNVKEKRETSAFITAPHPDLFEEAAKRLTESVKSVSITHEGKTTTIKGRE